MSDAETLAEVINLLYEAENRLDVRDRPQELITARQRLEANAWKMKMETGDERSD